MARLNPRKRLSLLCVCVQEDREREYILKKRPHVMGAFSSETRSGVACSRSFWKNASQQRNCCVRSVQKNSARLQKNTFYKITPRRWQGFAVHARAAHAVPRAVDVGDEHGGADGVAVPADGHGDERHHGRSGAQDVGHGDGGRGSHGRSHFRNRLRPNGARHDPAAALRRLHPLHAGSTLEPQCRDFSSRVRGRSSFSSARARARVVFSLSTRPPSFPLGRCG